jgi:hypothetical protein
VCLLKLSEVEQFEQWTRKVSESEKQEMYISGFLLVGCYR